MDDPSTTISGKKFPTTGSEGTREPGTYGSSCDTASPGRSCTPETQKAPQAESTRKEIPPDAGTTVAPVLSFLLDPSVSGRPLVCLLRILSGSIHLVQRKVRKVKHIAVKINILMRMGVHPRQRSLFCLTLLVRSQSLASC